MQATEIARQSDLRQSSNGVRYTAFGENNLESADLARIVQAVPASIAVALGTKAYYFVPLALIERVEEMDYETDQKTGGQIGDEVSRKAGQPIPLARNPQNEDTMIATRYTVELSDQAICHRNVRLGGASDSAEGGIDGVFISTRLLADRFALAFEFFINVGHAFVDLAGIPAEFSDLVWKQTLAEVRGETSLDAWESRGLALSKQDGEVRVDEKARLDFLEAAFSDALAIYLLSLAIDFDYVELRERDYPLLAPVALADRLRLAARLFPPNAGYDFSIRYRRRR